MKRLEQLEFDNAYARLEGEFHSPARPLPLRGARLIDFNAAAAALIDLDPAESSREDFAAIMGGAQPLAGMSPVAMCYSGHQFGVYVPRLGDGRAILLGQVRNGRGERWDLHLKGAGPTEYSRGGDGRAVLRSTIREYLCSEAMHGLGIPTTRALCIIGSDEEVYRERPEPGAMLLRMAPGHVRFGSFEYFYYTGQPDALRRLADYTIAAHFPELAATPHPYLGLLEQAINRTARLIAQWQAVGFAHGVMNSDNMSILGLTLDYGPFGFQDTFAAGFVCNHSDHHGRYAFDRQPQIGLFNLSCLAQALLPLLAESPLEAAEMARACLMRYQPHYEYVFATIVSAKLGLQEQRPGDMDLWHGLLALLERQADYTNTLRGLAAIGTRDATPHPLRDRFVDRTGFDAWCEQYRQRLRTEQNDDTERAVRMRAVNPKYVLRNYLAEAAIRRATDAADYSEIATLLRLLQRPYDEQPEYERYAAEPPDWARAIEVSCSS